MPNYKGTNFECNIESSDTTCSIKMNIHDINVKIVNIHCFFVIVPYKYICSSSFIILFIVRGCHHWTKILAPPFSTSDHVFEHGVLGHYCSKELGTCSFYFLYSFIFYIPFKFKTENHGVIVLQELIVILLILKNPYNSY